MATGISLNEKLSNDALLARRHDEHSLLLPNAEASVRLEYEGKLPEGKILEPVQKDFFLYQKGKFRAAAIDVNSFVLADNFLALHKLLSEGKKATLIYLDPPYGTGMDFQSRQLEHAYNDNMGAASYLEFMRRRLILMRELLTDDGSIYLHIGHQMVGHLKVLMDEIFGAKNFRNVITRRKCSSKNYTRNQYPNLNDYILFYSKSASYKWNQPGEKPTEEWINKEYPKADSKGRYKLVPVHAPGTRKGETGKPWKGMNPPPGKHWQLTPQRLDELDSSGEIHWSKNGNPRRKVYLTADKMRPLTDYWEQFRDAHHQSIEITGYPTEKNMDMMKMIVSASSAEGDLVVDPFCGSGTTLGAAAALGRKWIGIDQSFAAAKATLGRFRTGTAPMGDFVGKKAGGSQQLLPLAAIAEPIPHNFLVIDSVLEEYGEALKKVFGQI